MKFRAGNYSISAWLFALGFFTSTWDNLGSVEVGGFTLKLYQPLFLASLGMLAWQKRRQGPVHFVQPLSHPFAVCMLLLGGFYMGLSPWSAFPLKSFLYSCWLVFDVAVIWLSAQHLAKEISRSDVLRLIWFVMAFLAIVVASGAAVVLLVVEFLPSRRRRSHFVWLAAVLVTSVGAA